MKRLLSRESLSSEPHAGQIEDDASTTDLTTTQKLKRSRRAKTRSAVAVSYSASSQFVDEPQDSYSPQSGSHLTNSDRRPCSCVCVSVNDTTNAANTARLDSLLQLLTEQQQSIANMQGKLASVLSYLKRVSDFLGMDFPPQADARLLTGDHLPHSSLIHSETTITNEQSID